MKQFITLVFVFMLLASTVGAQDVALQGDISANRTLSADSTYLLKGFVRVKSGATLTIPAGTMLYGDYNTQGSMIVQPGGKIMAQGMVNRPIVFTSQFAKPGSSQNPQRGDWGGVIILGKAPLNVPGGTAAIEGPGDSYGGTDPDDNSGVLSYVRIEYAGIAFSPNNEINSLTMGGVGRGTKIDHIQVSYANDDSYEWFGGTVNCKYLIAYRGLDDDFDTDFGYQGKLQFLLGVRDPEVADVSGSNGFESDNDGSGSTNDPRTGPTWWNVTLVGPMANSSTTFNSNYKRGMHLRRSSQNKISNALLMGWPTGLLIDGTNTVADAQSGAMYVKNSILSGMKANFQSTDATFQGTMDTWFTTNGGRVFTANSEVLLTDAFTLSNPNVMPTSGSPVLTGGANPPDDGFFDPAANYVGAFGKSDWTAGWSTFQYPAQGSVVLQGDLTTDRKLSADSTYLLRGFVRVKAGATLTIPAGTMIYGEYNTQGSLIVQPGGKIMAQGTVNKPIIFSSEFSKPGAAQTPQRGDWGGIILLGKAPINVPGGKAAIEGPGDSYGGTDPEDNSGVLSYVRIEYAGIAFSPNNEINGLTFGGVGRGTKVDHIQVSYANDDSYEWFGGTVNCSYLIAYRGLDDEFDTDFGYQGKLQFLLGVRDPEVADVSGSNGFESDNDGSGSTNNPRTSPTWWNVTLIGPMATSSTAINSNYKRGMHLRRSSQNKVSNALLMGWPTGLLIDGTNTVADAQSGAMYVKNSILSGMKTNFQSTDATFQGTMDTWFTNNGGKVFAANSEVLLADPFNLMNPNVMPTAGSPALVGGGTPPADGFFDATANFIGAFGKKDWTAGWSTFNFPVQQGISILQGDIVSNRTLSADSSYLLRGFVRVKAGATLTIPAGVKLYGEYNTQGSLIVQPGGKIMAQGTATSPIIFTSEFAKPGSEQNPQRGDWGGIILLGNAPINVPGGTAAIEGPGDSYGGTDPDDNSGVLSFVRIEYAGIAFSPNNEINGLTFGGVGRGTKVDHIQVSYANDDSYEWFGGTVNCSYLIAYRGLDDEFDTDFGYQGKLQFLLGVRDPEVADVSGSNGFESDNDGSGSTNNPRTSPTWWNVTLIGPMATSSTAINSNYKRGMHLRRSSQNKVSNALLMGWPTGLLIDGTNTVADAQSGAMYVKNSVLSGMKTNFQSTDATFQGTMDTWFTTNGGRVFAGNNEVLLADAFNLTNPNAMPTAGSPLAVGGANPPDDGFFDATATFIGAFGKVDWTAGWSSFKYQVPTGVEEKMNEVIPTEFALSANYPNPFNPATSINFSLPKAGYVKLAIYNITGQQVATLIDGRKEAGSYNIKWEAGTFPSGVYIYSLETDSRVITRKMTLLK